MDSVFSKEQVNQAVSDLGITDLAAATIGQVVLLAQKLEASTGEKFIRMDQGVPGFEPCAIGIQEEQRVLDTGIAAIYPPADGIAPLKNEASRFLKAFIDVDIAPSSCIPVVGSVEGSFGAFVAATQRDAKKKKVLFIDPGFPIQKSQLQVIGVEWVQFDIYDYRGDALREKIESYLSSGEIAAIIYSNPNNPAWICLDEAELRIIGHLATKYDVIVLEDLAYFCMDFRKDLAHPFAAPYQASVARYTDNYILM
ncbi:MAG: aminotransferase class I/II-fold pyridoxal phosphate-dependent enzyme, partial [Mucinivorans sp.]